MFLPEILRIRVPEAIYKASEHGYNIKNLYEKSEELSEGYEHSLLLLQTTNGVIMGAYLDFLPAIKPGKF